MTPRRREALILGLVGAGAAAAGALVGALAWQSGSGAAALLAATYPDLSGRPRRLVEWQGKVLLCNFWATWCAPCREEIPLLVQTQALYDQKGVQVIGIGIDQAAKMQEFAANYRVTYPILVADAGGVETMKGLGNSSGGLPFTVVLDRSGRVAERKLGAFNEAGIRQVLDGLLR